MIDYLALKDDGKLFSVSSSHNPQSYTHTHTRIYIDTLKYIKYI